MESIVIEVSGKNIDKVIKGVDRPVIIAFWAEWSDPCSIFLPIVEEVANEFKSSMTFVKIDIDANISIADEYDVRGIPTLVAINKEQVTRTIIGAMTKAELITFITPFFAKSTGDAVI